MFFLLIFNFLKGSLVISYLVTFSNIFILSNFIYFLAIYYRNPRYILNTLNYKWLKILRKKNNSTVNPNRFNRRRKNYNPSINLNVTGEGPGNVNPNLIRN